MSELHRLRAVHLQLQRMGEELEVEMKSGEARAMATPEHVVVIPHPFQGHVTPALQLAKKLAALGLRITFVNTTHGERITKSLSTAMAPLDGIEFALLADGQPEEFSRFQNFQQCQDALLAMGPAFEELLKDLLPITCVIRDIRTSAVHDVAKRLGIPVVGFATPSAISVQCMVKCRGVIGAGILPLPPPPAGSTPSLHPQSLILGASRSEEETKVRQVASLTSHIPGAARSMRVEDLPSYMLAPYLDSWLWQLLREVQSPLLPDCECILLNTFHSLEGDVLDAMSGEEVNSIVYAVGPLVVTDQSDIAPRVREADADTISWLDARSPGSVLFVSFGSLATISVDQMREFVLGFEMSGYAFLWVIRADAIEDLCEVDAEFETTFAEFVIRTRDRALLVPWVPQMAVLGHSSVGAFLTHCGWNSTIESISSGIPMLAWPRFGDQPTNCHYITDVWRIGVQLLGLDSREDAAAGGTIVPSEEVDRKVRQIMGTHPDADQIRANSRNLQMAAKKAVTAGGSSQIALAKFVELVKSWSTSRSKLSQVQVSSPQIL